MVRTFQNLFDVSRVKGEGMEDTHTHRRGTAASFPLEVRGRGDEFRLNGVLGTTLGITRPATSFLSAHHSFDKQFLSILGLWEKSIPFGCAEAQDTGETHPCLLATGVQPWSSGFRAEAVSRRCGGVSKRASVTLTIPPPCSQIQLQGTSPQGGPVGSGRLDSFLLTLGIP